jgi:hypothetical protein
MPMISEYVPATERNYMCSFLAGLLVVPPNSPKTHKMNACIQGHRHILDTSRKILHLLFFYRTNIADSKP